MEIMDIDEPTRDEPTGFMQRWRKRWRNPSSTMKTIYWNLLCMIIVPLLVIYAGWPSNDFIGNPKIPDSELQNQAAYYMKSLNKNSRPCEDFYAFACGNLRREYRQEGQQRFETMDVMEKRARVSLNDFLTKPLNTSDSARLRQIKIFLQMCINKTKVETEGIEPVLTLLKKTGGWPLLTNDSENNESWETIVRSVNRAGFVTSFPYYLRLYTTNSSVTAIFLTPFLGPDHPPILLNEKRTRDYVKRVALLLNATNNRLDYDVKNIIDFESKLQEVTNSVVQGEEDHTLESLKTNYPEIAWKTFFRNVYVSTGIEVSSNEPIRLSHPEYNVKVSKLLSKTPAKIVRNYVVWRLIVEAIPLMPEKFRKANNAFQWWMVRQSRIQDCVDALIVKARVSIGYSYINHFFDGLTENMSHSMIKGIRSQAHRFLKNMSWMDNNTNMKIIETLRNLKMMLPHPDDSKMETLEFQSNDTLFANYRRLSEAQRNFLFGRLRISDQANQQLIPFEFAMKPNGLYLPLANISFMLAATFQRPFFSTSQPMYLNYGGIGVAMAHEMTHGLKILSFCNNEKCPSFDRFQEKEDCMTKLYDGYIMKQLHETVNGKSTLQENIGDLIGLTLAYRAYEEFAKGSKEPLLPGLNYTARQWFWINAATTLCRYEDNAALWDTITYDWHSPAEARVNVAFANTDEFSRDFECPIGSRMNPARKCRLEE